MGLRLVWRILKWTVLGVLAILIAVPASLVLSGYRSLPTTEGRVEIPVGGRIPSQANETLVTLPSAAIDIVRDHYGVPTIRAQSESDAYFALGWVHAQDRLWQMESMRRFGSGRMAELIGGMGVSLDRFSRVLGLRHLAEDSLRRLDDPTRAALEAYTAGVNAWLKLRDRPLPIEFQLLWHEPEPWSPVDSLVWQRIMALQLSGNWSEELKRAAVMEQIGPARTADLWLETPPGRARLADPEDPGTGAWSLPRMTQSDKPAARPASSASGFETLPKGWARAFLDSLPEEILPRLASNAWAVDGAKTVTGAPFLAGDPHLGLQAPTQWYLVRVETPDRLWAGGTFPGVPLLVLGHNGDIAWSLTTTHSDTADLVVERVTADGDYLTEDGPEAFIERQETIQVRFSEPETITVRASRAGPVLSDAAPRWIAPMVEVSRTSLGPPENADEETVLVLRAAALAGDDRTATAMFGINHARNWPDFVAALEDFHSPQQNFVYADRSGTIGLLNRGRLPNRIAVAEETDPIAQARLDGRLPRPGWTDQGKWQGWVAPAALPRVVNPPSGFLMNTNNKVSAPDDPLFLTHRWNGLWRAQRLERLLTHKDDHQLIDMGIYQLDSLSEAVAWMLPDLIRLAREAPQPHGEGFTKALGLLEEWTIAGDMNQNRVEPLLATSWMFLLSRELLADELGPLADRFAALDPQLLRHLLESGDRPLADDGTGGWCDDMSTPEERESCAEIAKRALNAALEGLRTSTGEDPFSLTWGDLHKARFNHGLFGRIPGLDALTRLEAPTSGDSFTLNRGGWRGDWDALDKALLHRHGAGMRAIYDLADLERSGFILATGQSGNLFSRHYGDMLPLWEKGRYIKLQPPGPEEESSQLTLVPVAQ